MTAALLPSASASPASPARKVEPDPPPPPLAELLPALAPPAERVTWRCPTCGHTRRFVASLRPHLAGTWLRCGKCQAALGLYVLDASGDTWLRLAAV